MSGVLFGVLVYVLIQFAIGAWVSRRMTGETDYILAGRTLGITLVTFSVFATYFGAEAIVATGGSVYDKGLAGALVDPFGYAFAILLTGLLLARALWSRGLTTFADLFRQRYSPGVEKLVVAVLLPGSVIWAAAQVRAFGQVMSANSSLGLISAITLAAVLVGAYSVVGGLLADAVTDTIQGIAVLVGLVVLGVAVAIAVGGVPAAIGRVQSEKLSLLQPDDGILSVLERCAVPICGTLIAVELISRFLGARSANVAAIGTSLGGFMYLTIGTIPIFLGLVGPFVLPEIEDTEQTVARLAEVYLPGALHIVFVGAVVSAILSSVHAALHAPAAQISHNVILRVLPSVTDLGKLWSVRLTVLALSVFTYGIAVTSHGIHELVETASAFGGAGVFVVTLFALFTRFGGVHSAYAAVSSGLIVWLVGKYLIDYSVPYITSLAVSLVAYVAVALVEMRLHPQVITSD